MEASNLAKEFHGIKLSVEPISHLGKLFSVVSRASPAIVGPTGDSEQEAIEKWNALPIHAPFDAATPSTARYAAQEII